MELISLFSERLGWKSARELILKGRRKVYRQKF